MMLCWYNESMRMRKKGNLDTRIQECGDLLLATEGKFTNVMEFIKDKEYIDYKQVFGNDNPVCLDVGCGLGGFAIEFAKQNPNINLIALEMFSNVIIGAIDKAAKENLPNLRFLADQGCSLLQPQKRQGLRAWQPLFPVWSQRS